MASKVFQVAFEIAGKMGASFQSSFTSATAQMKTMSTQSMALRQGLSQLNQVDKQATRFAVLKKEVQTTKQQFQAAQVEVKRLAGEVNAAAQPTKKLQAEFEKAKNRAATLKSTLFNQRQELQTLRSSLSNAGFSTQKFTDSQKKLQVQLDKTRQAQSQLEKSQAGLISAQSKHAEATKRAGEIRGAMVDTAVMAAPLVVAGKAAIEFESAMADVRKVVDFDTPAQFKAMGNDILVLSKRIPMAANGLAAIVASGGQAGFVREELLQFTEDSAKMGVAFDITAEQSGQMMAGWRSAFKMNQHEVVVLADKINYLGNTTAASAPVISDVVTRIGALGDVAGMNSGQIAAMGATLAGMNIPAEIASTGIKNFLLALNAGEGATKSQAAAFAQLGLDAGEMAKIMQTDSERGIMLVLSRLKQIPEYARAATMTDLFGKESLAAIAPLITQTDVLQQNLSKVADATQYAGSMQKEYDARAATTENSLILMKNSMAATATTAGSVFLPALVRMATGVSSVSDQVSVLAQEHPQLTQAVVMTAGGLVAFRLAWLGVSFVMNQYAAQKAALLVLYRGQTAQMAINRTAMVLNSTATRGAAIAQWAMNSAMLASPITWIIAGITGVVTVLYLLYQHFDGVRTAIDTAWQKFAETFPNAAAVLQKIGDKAAWLAGKFKSLIGLQNDSAQMKAGMGNFRMMEGDTPIASNAAGGIYERGAFLTTFAENSREAAIPLDGSSRAISLWQRAGEMLGVSGGVTIYATFSPVVQGGGAEVWNEVQQQQESFFEQLKETFHQKARVSYGT